MMEFDIIPPVSVEAYNNRTNLEDLIPTTPLITDSTIITTPTPIQEFYANSNVFVTGATGFLGRILIEKLLRSCPDLSTIYILIRKKKGKDLMERLDELFDDMIFNRLKEECPKFRFKVVGVAGDCSLPQLGLSEADRKMLIDEVHVIFHVAATVRFDEKLSEATAINVRSPRDIVHLSRQMSQLRCFMHVSTAFANCPNYNIEERIYSPPVDSKLLISYIESTPEKVVDQDTQLVLDKWPNTYAFTKCIAEDVIKQEGGGLPIGIFRPAIVISTYKEPVPAWINNLYGPTGVCAGAGTGVIHALHCDASKNANVVPADMCVNALIASAWEVSEKFEEEEKKFDIPVYNYVSSNDNPIDWGTFMDYSEKYGMKYPTARAVWIYYLILFKSAFLYSIAIIFVHRIPAVLLDGSSYLIGRERNFWSIYTKIHKFSKVIAYFSTRSWKFQSDRVQNMIGKMSEKDRDLFFCDLKQLNWPDFFSVYLRGIRIYLLQDPIETLEKGKRLYNWLYWSHQLVKVVLLIVSLWIISRYLL